MAKVNKAKTKVNETSDTNTQKGTKQSKGQPSRTQLSKGKKKERQRQAKSKPTKT